MKNRLILLSILLLPIVTACNTEDTPYTYLSQSNAQSDRVDLRLTISDTVTMPVQSLSLQARELYVDWGDGSKGEEYVAKPNEATVGEVTHRYLRSGNYGVVVKSVGVEQIILPQSTGMLFSSLKLTNCQKLKKLYCQNHPIPALDFSKSTQLEELVCGYEQGVQKISALSQVRKLRILSIGGKIDQISLDIRAHDSLRSVVLAKSNVLTIQINDLKYLSEIRIDGCDSISTIDITNNIRINRVQLTNNMSLEASMLNHVFQSLPVSRGGENFIVLKGNKGDATCDRSIATSKGWIFKDAF
ncbi:MAG: hypothetical protein RL662_2491 [Bacteroidota bacterium]